MLYLTDPDPRGSMGLGGKLRVQVGTLDNFLTAIDYRTGKAAWKHRYPGGGSSAGVLATAGRVLFTGDGSGNFVAFAATEREDPVAHAHRQHLECRADLHGRRPPARARRRQRHAVCVQDVLILGLRIDEFTNLPGRQAAIPPEPATSLGASTAPEELVDVFSRRETRVSPSPWCPRTRRCPRPRGASCPARDTCARSAPMAGRGCRDTHTRIWCRATPASRRR